MSRGLHTSSYPGSWPAPPDLRLSRPSAAARARGSRKAQRCSGRVLTQRLGGTVVTWLDVMVLLTTGVTAIYYHATDAAQGRSIALGANGAATRRTRGDSADRCAPVRGAAQTARAHRSGRLDAPTCDQRCPRSYSARPVRSLAKGNGSARPFLSRTAKRQGEAMSSGSGMNVR